MVTDAVGSCGRYSLPQFASDAVNRAIRAVGWTTICDCRCDELTGVRAHFFRVFGAYQKHEQLIQEFEALDQPELRKLLPWI